MLKEFVINRGIDLAAWRAKNGEYPLTPSGGKNFNDFIDRLKKGLPTNLSEQMGILDGYDYTSGIIDLANLRGLRTDKGCLILTNHEKELPLRGDSIILPIGFYVKQKTGKEIRWTYGTRSSLNQTAKGGYEKSLGFILVESKKNQLKGAAELLRAIGKDFVGLYPEGDNSDKLLKGKWEAGRVISVAASRGVDIICSSTYLDGKTFKVTFQKLDSNRIKELSKQIKNSNKQIREEAGQNVVDYAMNTIALPLPQEKRGYYQNPEETLGVDL